jgi:hypothetical protein
MLFPINLKAKLTEKEGGRQERRWSAEQLMEIGEKYRSSRKSQMRGKKWTTFTQNATGFMSLNTLRSLLREEGLSSQRECH